MNPENQPKDNEEVVAASPAETPEVAETNQTPQEPQAPVQGPAPQQNVQYVKMEQSLEGVGGWLAFWLVMFALGGIGMITAFFSSITATTMNSEVVTTLIFSPLLAVGGIAAAVLIAMRRKLALMFVYATLALSALFSIVGQIIVAADSSSSNNVPVLVGSILVTLVMIGLVGLYFYQSKRVKATLVE